jgi:hypothetical protein
MSTPDKRAKPQHGLSRFLGVSGLDDKSRRAPSDLFGKSKLSDVAADALKAQWPKPPPSALSAIQGFGMQSREARKTMDRTQDTLSKALPTARAASTRGFEVPPPRRIEWPGQVEAKWRAAAVRREEAMLAELGAMRKAVERAAEGEATAERRAQSAEARESEARARSERRERFMLGLTSGSLILAAVSTVAAVIAIV